jgi:DNA polymerase III subunit delta
MAEVKSHEFDAFLKSKPLPARLFLVYGPDRGLVSERASALAVTSGVNLDDAFSVVKLDAGDIGTQPGRLIDEMNAIGLFGGDRLVWIRNAGSEKGLSDGLEILTGQPAGPSTLIIEAGDLKKGAALRKAAESSSQAVAIACYADDGRALQALIDQELAAEGMRISPAARERLVETIGGDRLASRNEVRKLALYCRGKELIEEQDVEEIVGDLHGRRHRRHPEGRPGRLYARDPEDRSVQDPNLPRSSGLHAAVPASRADAGRNG